MQSGGGRFCARIWVTPPGGKGSGRGGAKKGPQQHICTEPPGHVASGSDHVCDCGRRHPVDDEDRKGK